MTMRSSEIINGSKIMLMATQGLHQGVSFVDHYALLFHFSYVLSIVSANFERADSNDYDVNV